MPSQPAGKHPCRIPKRRHADMTGTRAPEIAIRQEDRGRRRGSSISWGSIIFGRVRFVVLWNATPKNIAAAARLSGLRRLGINGSALCDADQGPLKRLADLEELSLSCAPATDAGLAHLRGLGRLRKLTLVDSGVTDDGLVQLKSLTSIRVLKLRFAKITDAGLARLNDHRTTSINRSLDRAGPGPLAPRRRLGPYESWCVQRFQPPGFHRAEPTQRMLDT